MSLEPLPTELQGLHVLATKHAKEGLEELKIPFRRAVAMIFHGCLDRPIRSNSYKTEKYGEQQEDVIYVRNGTVIFTIRKTKNNFNQEETILLLITVTDQQVTAKIPVKEISRDNFSWSDPNAVLVETPNYGKKDKHKNNQGVHTRPRQEKRDFLRDYR